MKKTPCIYVLIFRCVSISSELVGWLLSCSVTLSDFYTVDVSWPSQNVRRPWDVICFLKAMTKNFQTSIFRKCIFWKCIFKSLAPKVQRMRDEERKSDIVWSSIITFTVHWGQVPTHTFNVSLCELIFFADSLPYIGSKFQQKTVRFWLQWMWIL